MAIKVKVVDGERKREAFSNPVVGWRFSFEFGPRYENQVVSRKQYSSPDGAHKAGKRQLARLIKAAKEMDDA